MSTSRRVEFKWLHAIDCMLSFSLLLFSSWKTKAWPHFNVEQYCMSPTWGEKAVLMRLIWRSTPRSAEADKDGMDVLDTIWDPVWHLTSCAIPFRASVDEMQKEAWKLTSFEMMTQNRKDAWQRKHLMHLKNILYSQLCWKPSFVLRWIISRNTVSSKFLTQENISDKAPHHLEPAT